MSGYIRIMFKPLGMWYEKEIDNIAFTGFPFLTSGCSVALPLWCLEADIWFRECNMNAAS